MAKSKSFPCVNHDDEFKLYNGGLGIVLRHAQKHFGDKVKLGDGFLFLWNSESAIDKLIAKLQLLKKVIHTRNNPGKKFKVAAISSNANEFGLHQVVLMAQDGEAWTVGASASSLDRIKKGDVLGLEPTGESYNFAGFGFEIPERAPDASAEVLKEVWT